MSYTTPAKVVLITGLGEEVIAELIGTGDGSNDSYELENEKIISSTYTLFYGASGSNDFTDLVETTDYTIDINSGKILLTAGGITKLGNNLLYATYIYSTELTDSQLQEIIDQAEEEVNKETGNYWGPPKANTELFDGQGDAQQTYPTTDEPFANDYDEPDNFILKYRGINSITGVSALAKNVILSSVQSYDSTLASYTDNTSKANTYDGDGFQPFGATTAVGDYIYIGSAYKFGGLNTVLFTLGVTAGTNTIEYWNGSAWTAFTPTESTTGVLNFAANGKLTWNSLNGWSKTSVNGGSPYYYIRIVAASTYTTEAVINSLYMDQDTVILNSVPLYQVNQDGNGEVIINGRKFVKGRRNVRIDYIHGYSETPTLITELTGVIAGIITFVRITGGSFDTPSSYSLPEGEVSVGQVYVNVREAVSQLDSRMNSLLDSVGRKMDVYASF